MDTPDFHRAMDKLADELLGSESNTREALLNGAATCSREEVIAQLMMENLFPHPCDPESDGEPTTMTTEQKKFLVGVATHMGPDYAQALYHAAVFITKVA